MTLAHEYWATSTRPLKMFCKIFTGYMVTCKIKHLQNICKNVLEPTALKRFYKCFILRVTTVYLQAVFDPAKNVLRHFCKRFSVKHF